jgi:hypothetical protein
MSITAISRDCLTETVDIVRIISSDSLTTINAAGYITSQQAAIEALNNGLWEWNSQDEILINYGGTVINNVLVGGTNALYQISPDFSSLIATTINQPTFQGLTAHAGGGQANGTPLKPGLNTFTTVVTAADSATLPVQVEGQSVTVTNASATSMDVYPASGDTINALSANTPLAVAAGVTVTFLGNTATGWVSH